MRRFPIRALPARSRTVRFTLAAVLAVALCLVAACGSGAQTTKPYTPSEGINFDIGTVHVRNLVVINTAAGQGVLSASLISAATDQLKSVGGTAIKADGSDGAAITGTITDSVTVANNVLVVLTNQTPVTVKSADLAPGLSARLTLEFATAGSMTVVVPVVSSTFPPYSTAVPSASASTTS